MTANNGESLPRLAVTGHGLWRTGNLAALLDDHELVRVSGPRDPALDGAAAVLGWGGKPSAARAAAIAGARGLPLLRIEDGFLRSVGLGADEPPWSIVLDDEGIYYDARGPSRLESLVRAGADAAAAARARALRQAWCEARVSKYNHAREDALDAPLPDDFVLVVDQTAGDLSITGALADAESFTCMLEAARERFPGSVLLLKVHPDVIAARKRGHFDLSALARDPRVRIVSSPVHPVPLIERARAVFVVSSQVGFEALLHGRPVHVFGMPFYAGWGLTTDALSPPSRRQPAAIEALVHAALVDYPRYLDPETGRRCDAERLVTWMALQRRMRERFPARIVARRFSPWKRPVLRRFLAGSAVTFARWRCDDAPGTTVATWGRALRDPRGAGVRAISVEDGFVRSVGLGADLIAPLSWVLDDVGIYYDATQPSRLEQLLETGGFDAALLARAAALRASVCRQRITKYNLAGNTWHRPPGDRKVILVPGQVEGDASIRWGAPGIHRNIDLLRAVRAENPDAWIVYKPHPDVVAGVRRRGEGEADVSQYCDEAVVDVPMDVLLDRVDAVHVLTSLTGFEALLRGRHVVCWGMPFYAGWGLTDDRERCARRTRRCALDELVAATLVLYPTYVSRASGGYTTPERALSELAQWRAQGAAPPSGWTRTKRAFMRWRARLPW